jgi:hypothetical protein
MFVYRSFMRVLPGKREANVKRSISILNLSLLLVASMSAFVTAQDIASPELRSSKRLALKNQAGEQCMFVRGAGQRYDRALLTVPADGCVFEIDSWVIKTDRYFRPTEVVSPNIDRWKVTLKNIREIPIVDDKDWSFKVKIRGGKQAVAVLSYRFD